MTRTVYFTDAIIISQQQKKIYYQRYILGTEQHKIFRNTDYILYVTWSYIRRWGHETEYKHIKMVSGARIDVTDAVKIK